jgi:hypothetical protein
MREERRGMRDKGQRREMGKREEGLGGVGGGRGDKADRELNAWRRDSVKHSDSPQKFIL